MRRDYERLSIIDFGRHLLDSEDLDPVYCALPHTLGGEDNQDIPQLHRWLIAYWCFYHCGVASWLSEHKGLHFWKWMRVAAENMEPAPTGITTRWPRGSERRHFRGEAAVNAIRHLHDRYGNRPQNMVTYIHNVPGDRVPYKAIADRASDHPLFGPWISFKIADMCERVLGIPVDFNQAEVFMFKDPVKSALMLWRQHEGLPETAEPKDKWEVIREVVAYVGEAMMARKAPPGYDRLIGLQEIETILCKWKSHMNGHYPLYNDIDEINEGLEPWSKISETALRFMECMPRRPS